MAIRHYTKGKALLEGMAYQGERAVRIRLLGRNSTTLSSSFEAFSHVSHYLSYHHIHFVQEDNTLPWSSCAIFPSLFSFAPPND